MKLHRAFLIHVFAGLALFPLLLFGRSVHAAEYHVEIWQLRPDGLRHDITCDDSAKQTCRLLIPVIHDNGEARDILVHVSFKPGGIDLRFEWNGHYFSTSGYGNDSFYMPVGDTGAETRNITLYRPHPLVQSDSVDSLRHRPVQRVSYDDVVDLEVTVAIDQEDIAPPEYQNSGAPL